MCILYLLLLFTLFVVDIWFLFLYRLFVSFICVVHFCHTHFLLSTVLYVRRYMKIVYIHNILIVRFHIFLFCKIYKLKITIHKIRKPYINRLDDFVHHQD